MPISVWIGVGVGLVLLGLGWYKFAYLKGVEDVARKVREEAAAEAKLLSENAEKVHVEMEERNDLTRISDNDYWS